MPRLQQLISEATAAGAEAIAVIAPARDGQRRLPLTVLTACSNDVRVTQQHLFGPVLPLDAEIAYVTETLMHIAQDGQPFGCVGPSSLGHYHGKFGFDTLSKSKPVFRQSRINALGLSAPRYGASFLRVIGSSCSPKAREFRSLAIYSFNSNPSTQARYLRVFSSIRKA